MIKILLLAALVCGVWGLVDLVLWLRTKRELHKPVFRANVIATLILLGIVLILKFSG